MASELNVANQILTAASVKTLDNYIIKRIVVCLFFHHTTMRVMIKLSKCD